MMKKREDRQAVSYKAEPIVLPGMVHHPNKKIIGAMVVLSLVVQLCLLALPAHAVEKQPLLDKLIAEALENNSELLALEENVRALEHETLFFGSLQDPVVGIGLLNVPVDSFDLDQEPMTQKQLFVAQKFPWFGTLELRQQVAAIKALQAGNRLQSKRLELTAQVATLWYELGIQNRSLEVVVALQDIVLQSLRIAESRYATGKGSQRDILNGQVQYTELINESVELKSKVRVNRAKLTALLNRVDRSLLEGTGKLASETNNLDVILPGFTLLLETGFANSPVYQELLYGVDRAKLGVALAEAAYYPNFDLRFSYGQREDNPVTGDDRADFVSTTVAMTVPLYRSTRQDAKLRGAEKRRKAALTSVAGFRKTLPHRIDRLVADIEGLSENYTLIQNGLTVQAVHLASASLAAYSVGKVEFSTMLSARIGLLRLELRADVAKYKIYKKIVELEQLIGVSLPTLLEGSK